MRRCDECGTAPVVGERHPEHPAHPNAKYCAACRAKNRTRPKSTLTPEQGAEVARLTGTMPRTAIAAQLGVSVVAVKRYVREHQLYGRSDVYPPEVVAAVLAAYTAAPKGAGKRRVQELFPDVNVRAIVERHHHDKRQIRWTDAQIHEAARMAGLVSANAQARWFGRPNASGGSLKALWDKRFHCPPGDIGGLGIHLAWRLALPGCPALLVRRQEAGLPIAKVLWLDLADWLRPDVAPWIVSAVQALARFQRWLHGGATREAIAHMIQERERYADH
jgi:hypothetical protein